MLPPPTMREKPGFATNLDVRPRWRTKDGLFLLPREMTDRHLENAIRFAIRNARGIAHRETMDAWDFSMQCRGEMAQYYADRDAEELEEIAAADNTTLRRWIVRYPIVRNMLKERSQRKRSHQWNP